MISLFGNTLAKIILQGFRKNKMPVIRLNKYL